MEKTHEIFGGTDSLTAAARQLARSKLDLVGVQEVRWDKGGRLRAGYCTFLWKKEMNSVSS